MTGKNRGDTNNTPTPPSISWEQVEPMMQRWSDFYNKSDDKIHQIIAIANHDDHNLPIEEKELPTEIWEALENLVYNSTTTPHKLNKILSFYQLAKKSDKKISDIDKFIFKRFAPRLDDTDTNKNKWHSINTMLTTVTMIQTMIQTIDRQSEIQLLKQAKGAIFNQEISPLSEETMQEIFDALATIEKLIQPSIQTQSTDQATRFQIDYIKKIHAEFVKSLRGYLGLIDVVIDLPQTLDNFNQRNNFISAIKSNLSAITQVQLDEKDRNWVGRDWPNVNFIRFNGKQFNLKLLKNPEGPLEISANADIIKKEINKQFSISPKEIINYIYEKATQFGFSQIGFGVFRAVLARYQQPLMWLDPSQLKNSFDFIVNRDGSITFVECFTIRLYDLNNKNLPDLNSGRNIGMVIKSTIKKNEDGLIEHVFDSSTIIVDHPETLNKRPLNNDFLKGHVESRIVKNMDDFFNRELPEELKKLTIGSGKDKHKTPSSTKKKDHRNIQPTRPIIKELARIYSDSLKNYLEAKTDQDVELSATQVIKIERIQTTLSEYSTHNNTSQDSFNKIQVEAVKLFCEIKQKPHNENSTLLFLLEKLQLRIKRTNRLHNNPLALILDDMVKLANYVAQGKDKWLYNIGFFNENYVAMVNNADDLLKKLIQWIDKKSTMSLTDIIQNDIPGFSTNFEKNKSSSLIRIINHLSVHASAFAAQQGKEPEKNKRVTPSSPSRHSPK